MKKHVILLALLLVASACGDTEAAGDATDWPRPDGD
jgi:hypothetical protein